MAMMANLAHQNLAAAAELFGTKRLMAFSAGETRFIVTSHPDVAKEILNSSVFADRPVKESAYQLMFNRSIGFAPYSVYWRTLRRIASTHLFCPKQIAATESHRREIASQMVSSIASNSGSEFCVRDVLMRASLNNMMCSIFGRKFDFDTWNGESEELGELVAEGYELLGKLNWSDHLTWLSRFDLQKIRFRCTNLVPNVNRIVNRIIKEHRARTGDQTNRDFVDVLLSLHGPDKLPDHDMVAVLWEMVFRGTDTTAILVEWILARLVMHPDIQSPVHDELDRVVGRSHALKETDIKSMVYLQEVVKEVLRLHPPGPLLSWAGIAISDTTVDGYKVPAETTAMVNIWAMARDPEVWADQLKFSPDRFLSKEGVVDAEIMEFSVFGSDPRLMPFGSGRRACPGKSLGLTTVTFWVAKLLHEFKWVESEEVGVDLSEVLTLSCEMASPLRAKVCQRRSGNGN